jgi:hypothetical protein
MVAERLWYRTDCVVRGCLFSWTGPASCLAEPLLQVGSYRLGKIVSGQHVRTLSCFVSSRRLSPQFQFSLSAAALRIYLYEPTNKCRLYAEQQI